MTPPTMLFMFTQFRCASCSAAAPKVRSWAAKQISKISLIEIDVQLSGYRPGNVNVKHTPHFALIQSDEKLAEKVGAFSDERAFEKWLKAGIEKGV